jgi:hypothetical protein
LRTGKILTGLMNLMNYFLGIKFSEIAILTA